jgi:hypothetical protein
MPDLDRGSVFGADHDTTFRFWVANPKWKRCLLFNLTPPEATDDAHYFIATASGVHYFREHPWLLSDVLIFAAGSYAFFPKETAIDFRSLCIVPIPKLKQNNLRVLGRLSADDIAKCSATAGSARQLENKQKKLLGLR